MKKRSQLLSLLIISIFLISSASAQIKIGFNAGANFGKYKYDKIGTGLSSKNITGFIAGGVLEYGLNKSFALRFSPSYVLRGSKQSSDIADTKVKSYYLELPVTAVYKLNTGSIKPYLSGGLSLGILTKAKANEIDVKASYNKTNFSVLMGLGCEFEINKNTSVFIDGHYNLGLKNISKQSDKVKTRGFDIKAGVLFSL